ncbi:glycoside hydrolase family protein [Rufibacter soli]
MWSKRGLIFNADNNYEWMVSHACVPTAIVIPDSKIRIYFAPRNRKGQSIPTFIDVSSENPSEVLYVHDKPILALGDLGTFDDGGIMPCSVIEDNGKLYLYYVGWNPSVSVPYRNSVGVAISNDGGFTFERLFSGPIVDRNMQEPYFTASPCVFKEGNKWQIWYASSTGFKIANNKPEPLYLIKYGFSSDGIHWTRDNVTCIYPKTPDEANARPSVIKENGIYKMWFCYRGSFDYRDGVDSYKIGYAESIDGVSWQRLDHLAGIELSSEGWDNKMQTYPCVIKIENKKYLFYNGNGFGKTGIGWAEWV